MSIRVSLAGQLGVETDGRVLDATHLPGRQGRVVLAYLVAERDRPVPSDELAEALWGPTPPATWRPALRGVVSKVRDFLEALGLPAADMLTSSSGCYRLVLPSDATVDVELAAGEADAAERALAAGDLEGALAAATVARQVAGRPLLPGQEGSWIEGRRAAWQEVLVRALQVLVDTSLAGGRGEVAVQPASELVGLEPFRESSHLRLLRAYAAAGDRGEALRAYDRCRRLLAEELGVDPSPELETAYLELLRDGAVAVPRPQAPPQRVPPAGERPFVGRGPELARLRAAWAAAQAGRRRLVLVTGEAGIGKSRLAAELMDLAEHDGATVLLGRCDRQLGVAYLPVRAALRPYLAACPAERLRALVGPQGGELVRLWPELARQLPGLPAPTHGEPEAERYLLFEAVAGLLDAIAATGPVLLVVDDLHEADQPSLALLRHLAHGTRPAALLVLLTATEEAATRGDVAGALAHLLRAPGSEHLALAGLDEGEVAAVAEAASGRRQGPAVAALAHVLHGRTGGNPFLVGELLRHLAETGALAAGEGARTAAGPAVDDVPATVRLVVGERLARLDGAVRHLLDVASVIGHRADLALLARVVDLGDDDLARALEVAVGAKLLDERHGAPGRYAFHHGIVHDVVYAGLPGARRTLLHHRSARPWRASMVRVGVRPACGSWPTTSRSAGPATPPRRRSTRAGPATMPSTSSSTRRPPTATGRPSPRSTAAAAPPSTAATCCWPSAGPGRARVGPPVPARPTCRRPRPPGRRGPSSAWPVPPSASVACWASGRCSRTRGPRSRCSGRRWPRSARVAARCAPSCWPGWRAGWWSPRAVTPPTRRSRPTSGRRWRWPAGWATRGRSPSSSPTARMPSPGSSLAVPADRPRPSPPAPSWSAWWSGSGASGTGTSAWRGPRASRGRRRCSPPATWTASTGSSRPRSGPPTAGAPPTSGGWR